VFLPGNRRSLPVRLVMIAAAVGLFVVGYQWGNRFQHRGGPPTIAGVLVSPPIALSDFALQDPEGRPVSRDRLSQGWTLLTYGDLTQAQGHLAVNRLLEVFNRLADHPALRAELRLDVLESIVPGHSAAELHPRRARGEIELVVHDEDLVRRDLVEPRKSADAAAGEVHVGLRLAQPDVAGGRGQARDQRLVLGVLCEHGPVSGGQPVEQPEADVVPIAGVPTTGIS